MSRYNRNGLPWSSGLGKNIEGIKSSREVMKEVGLDFVVKKCELVAKMPFTIGGNNHIDEMNGDFAYEGKVYKDVPNAFAIYRTDLDIPLGLVKQKYEVVQNMDAFNFFDDAIGEGKAIWTRAGYYGLGHKIFLTAKLPIETTVNGDKIDNYLVFSNSHDGTSSVDILFSPIRVICTNMLNSAFDSASSHIRLKHTKNVGEKIQEGSRILRIACEHAKSAEQLYQSLTTIKMDDDSVMRYIGNLVLTDTERNTLFDISGHQSSELNKIYRRLFSVDFLTMEKANISTRKANQLKQIFEYYLDGIGQQHITGTAWGAYNAITGFYSNVANLEGEKRMDSLLYGSTNRNMNKALNLASEFSEAA